MRVVAVTSRLLPLRRVRDDIVQVAVNNLSRFAARPAIHIGSRARTTARLVQRNLGSLTFAGIWADVLRQYFNQPAVIWRESSILDVGRRTHIHMIFQLREENSRD